MSRTTSTNTVTQIQNTPPAMTRSPVETGQTSLAHRRLSREAARRSTEASPKARKPSLEKPSSPSAIASSSSSSSSSSEEALHPMVRSRAFQRRPRLSSAKTPVQTLSDADEEEGDSPPFLPFSDVQEEVSLTSKDARPIHKPSAKSPATQRAPIPPALGPRARSLSSKNRPHSSSSSAQSQPHSHHPKSRHPPAALSPRQRRAVQEGSDGSPSMGSSFSDLDDASITQSALEEALANEMTHGGVASKMSTISQALKSRYL